MPIARARAVRPGPPRPAPQVRRPSQERGERRVAALLDAAASLIAEVGVEGITVQALADRARTSKGSLYHFFPDVPSVLRALAARHKAAITEIAASLIADPGLDWTVLSVREVVAEFLAPLDYLERHPDLLALVRAPNLLTRSAQGIHPILQVAEHILARRCPSMKPKRRRARAAVMVAVLDGAVGCGLHSMEVRAAVMREELERMLVAYLTAVETEAEAP